jgi:uncharacterized metal-binding protein YceD (DUF177 family)
VTPELHRPVALARIGPGGLDQEIRATPAECVAIAARLQLPGVHALSCSFHLRREPLGVAARGRLQAVLLQTCVVSLDEFETSVQEDFTLHFVPEGTEGEEIDPEAEDEVPYVGDTLDLGEATVQQLALALDPYPRKPGAGLSGRAEAATVHPFARLGALRSRH